MPHYHTLEVRDRFGNILDSYSDGGFKISLVGMPNLRASPSLGNGSLVIEAMVSNKPDERGKMMATFTPDIAGSYVMINEYTGPGGLLATFFHRQDFTDPVLKNSAFSIEVRRSPNDKAPKYGRLIFMPMVVLILQDFFRVRAIALVIFPALELWLAFHRGISSIIFELKAFNISLSPYYSVCSTGDIQKGPYPKDIRSRVRYKQYDSTSP